MSRIQITDLSFSDRQLGNELEELTDEELLAINGGGGIISDAMRFGADVICGAGNLLRWQANLLDRATDAVADGIRRLF
jgi:hypothetical protein